MDQASTFIPARQEWKIFEFVIDKSALDFFKSNPGCPRVRPVDKRDRPFLNLFGALGNN